MGLFSKETKATKTTCDICGQEFKKREGRLQAADGAICRVCYRESGMIRMFGKINDIPLSELQAGVEATKLRYQEILRCDAFVNLH